jgi:hypothetical protein
MIQQLVVNGCSYNEVWATGPGPEQLAQDLGLPKYQSIALGGANNSRILRTTIKHSYQTNVPSLYLVGLTFMSRWELPIIDSDVKEEFEGAWINPQSQKRASNKFIWNWTDSDTETYKNLLFKASTFATADQLEDLMYRCISVASDLQRRGHKIIFWNNPDQSIPDAVKNSNSFDLLKNNPAFVDGLLWVAIPWQHEQGAAPAPAYPIPGIAPPPQDLRHISSLDYRYLNGYLTQWINDNKILT